MIWISDSVGFAVRLGSLDSPTSSPFLDNGREQVPHNSSDEAKVDG